VRAPRLAVGDDALGFWATLRDVWPETKTQRCWLHKVANCLAALPKSAHPTARRMLAEIRDAEDRDHAVRAAHAFAHEFGAKWPKAVAKIVDDLDALPAFYDFPAEHWIHLKTTNPIESTFSTVRLRTRVTKGAGSRAAALAMAFKLIQSAEQRWRAVNGAAPRRPRPRRSSVQEGSAHRATQPAGSGSRGMISGTGRSTGLDNSSRSS
jgi:transposase-like protein